MKKTIRLLALGLLACILCLTVTACLPEKEPETIIESLTATEPSTTLKIGETVLLTNMYKIKGTAALSAAQRACTYESSNPEIVAINGKRAEALASGTATITVTSNVDQTKSCSFEIVVARVFIDRDITMIPSEDDFSNEWDEQTGTGSFRTSSGLTNFYYIADIFSDKWYVETDITIHKVTNDDQWPKIGIVASGKNSREKETMVAFFLNATVGLGSEWNEFGVCEVSEGNHWAWEPNIPDNLARHHDYAWNTGDSKITYGTTFKLGVARNGMDFHVYVNGNYVGSFQLSKDLDILYNGETPVASHVGFFHFNCDATYANYKATADEAEVLAKCPETPVYCGFLDDEND